MDNQINVAVSINDNYCEPLIVMLTSLFINNKESKFTVYLLFSDLQSKNLNDIKNCVENYHADLKAIMIERDFFNQVSSVFVPHVSRETFYRLLLPELLPSHLDRILYLDPDIIVQGSIASIYHMDFHGKSIIAASVAPDNGRWNLMKKKLRIPLKSLYFNAGVTILNLVKLREDQHFKKDFLLNYLNNNYKQLGEGDQAYLNKFLWNKSIILNCLKYNYNTVIYCDLNESITKRIRDVWKELRISNTARKNAVIIHYRGPSKPWHSDYCGKLGDVYWKYANIAGYKRKQGDKAKNSIAKVETVFSFLFKVNRIMAPNKSLHNDFNPGIGQLIRPNYLIRKALYERKKKYAAYIKDRVLAIGCGSKPYKDLFQQATEYIGLDTKNSGHSTQTSDVDIFYDGIHMPIDDSAFDNGVCFQVLEHVEDIPVFLDEIARVIKENGFILFDMPFIWEEHEVPYDFRRYTSYGLKKLFCQHGFEIIRYEKYNKGLELICQFLNLYYRKAYCSSKVVNTLINCLMILPTNIFGIILKKIKIKDEFLYGGHIILVRNKRSNKH